MHHTTPVTVQCEENAGHRDVRCVKPKGHAGPHECGPYSWPYSGAHSAAVDHPAHYGGKDDPYEHIKVVQAWGLNYQLGNATKYIARAGKKTENPIEDLKKARFYLDYEIQRLGG